VPLEVEEEHAEGRVAARDRGLLLPEVGAQHRPEGFDDVVVDLVRGRQSRLFTERDEHAEVLAVGLDGVLAARPGVLHPEQEAMDVVGQALGYEPPRGGDAGRRGEQEGFDPLRGLAPHDRHPGHSMISQRSSAGR
jgi:hypothetical protein